MLLLFPLFVAATDEMASEKYCFPSGPGASLARKKFTAIQVPSDVVTLDGNCLVIQMRPHRRELIQKYILSSVNGGAVTFSSAAIRREPCKLKVEKIKDMNKKILSGGIENQQVFANQTETIEAGTDVMQIDTLNEFQLSVDQNEIRGNCKYITSNRYEIALEVRKNPKPIVPANLPDGSVVVVKAPLPDQNTMLLKTQLQLSRGERIEVGDLIQKLTERNHSINVKPSLNIENRQQRASEKVFLSLQ